ncbi:LysR family transcriptional regulator [Massilia cavernae]|uniref:LysR family transcriptional regulator n=1 Tax=Massilia cavernae TaxID=2320864 RepID=A0A418Y6F2_9BURK|nr:LysR family transcriptional regulator [Massilia cavernae]RJG23450.1 LysR family transcriptional regulator [Massilia cavernae]
MELRDLRFFLAVVENPSFSRAAEQMGVSQQAISRHIQGLEQSVGVQLLERDQRAAVPTALGRSLVHYAHNILAESAGFQRQVDDALAGRRASVRLGSSPTASTQLVSEAVLSLQRDRGHLHLDVIAGALPSAAHSLMNGEMDLFVGIDNGSVVYEGIERETLGTELYCVVAGNQHPLAQMRAPAPELLCQSDWILGKFLGEVEAGWRDAFVTRGLPVPAPKITTTSLDFCKTILISSPYLSLLPKQLVESDIDSGALSCLMTEGFMWERPIALFYRRNTTFSEATMATIDALRVAAHKYRRALAASAATR